MPLSDPAISCGKAYFGRKGGEVMGYFLRIGRGNYTGRDHRCKGFRVDLDSRFLLLPESPGRIRRLFLWQKRKLRKKRSQVSYLQTMLERLVREIHAEHRNGFPRGERMEDSTKHMDVV